MRNPQIEVRWNTEVVSFHGAGGKLNSLSIANKQTGKEEALDIDGAFVFIGLDPNTRFLQQTPLVVNEWGFIVTGHSLVHLVDLPEFNGREPSILETNVPGIFAAGDVRAGSTKQVASAAGEGATAALLAREYLQTV